MPAEGVTVSIWGNLFPQGLAHPDWLERNNMGIELVIEGPGGRSINSKKRVRLLLGFYGDCLPYLFWELRRQAMRRDRYLQIDFVQFGWADEKSGELLLTRSVEPDGVITEP